MRRQLLPFLSALPLIMLVPTAGLRAQHRETDPALRRVIIFVWDGLRADDLTEGIAPNYFALARSGVSGTAPRQARFRSKDAGRLGRLRHGWSDGRHL